MTECLNPMLSNVPVNSLLHSCPDFFCSYKLLINFKIYVLLFPVIFSIPLVINQVLWIGDHESQLTGVRLVDDLKYQQ